MIPSMVTQEMECDSSHCFPFGNPSVSVSNRFYIYSFHSHIDTFVVELILWHQWNTLVHFVRVVFLILRLHLSVSLLGISPTN